MKTTWVHSLCSPIQGRANKQGKVRADDQPQQWVGWYAPHDQPRLQNLVPTR
jgi:hypothetical protein